MTDLWPRLARLLAQAERPARYINHEWGATAPVPGTSYREPATPDLGLGASITASGMSAPVPGVYRFCMVYPDTYELGQPNQALRILCKAVNAQEGMSAERAFLPAPDFCDLMRQEGLPLFSLEGCAPLAQFDALGITLSHELVASNILEVLDLAGIPLHAADRDDSHPLVIGGGPVAYNPEPFHLFFDAFSLGEGEESVPELLHEHRRCKQAGMGRADTLRRLALVPGTYVPSLYVGLGQEEAQARGTWLVPAPRQDALSREAPRQDAPCQEAPRQDTLSRDTLSRDTVPVFRRRIFTGFSQSPAWEPCVVPFIETVHDRLNVEVLRGCTRGCRFCQAGMIYRPVRERPAEQIVSAVLEGLEATGYDEVSLTSLSTTDHSQIAAILTRLNQACEGKGIRISIPSQRLDAFGVSMAGLVAGRKKGGLTFAPEAGTQRLRDVINKNVTEDDLFNAIDAAFAAGWRHCKLYFMLGLPTETDDDVKGIASLAQRAYDRAREAVPPGMRGSIKMSVSCALFVPKPHTPFQWDGQIPPDEAMRRVNLLRSSVKYRAITVNWHDPATSLIEAALSRGGRECAAWIEGAWRRGARFDAWSECFNAQTWEDAAVTLGFTPAEAASRSWDTAFIPPWSHIDCGVETGFLRRERQRAALGQTTPDCSFGSCEACGLCPRYQVEPMTQEPRKEASHE
ncbi:MAG: radical SAM protein [Coriobacteriaceae bacterium]|jgi:radical SAM superfamily enzyme YgiQ (UPF0313 family)|nr:radical SAM protein [Coriobacteriaceae bacterium]